MVLEARAIEVDRTRLLMNIDEAPFSKSPPHLAFLSDAELAERRAQREKYPAPHQERLAHRSGTLLFNRYAFQLKRPFFFFSFGALLSRLLAF